MTYTISRRQALGLLAAPLVAGCRELDLVGPSFSSAANGAVTLIGACDPHCNKDAIGARAKTGAMVKAVLDADPTAWAFCGGDLTHRGSTEEYDLYYAPTWGRFKGRTIFTMGDHCRWPRSNNGAAYYAYTGAAGYFARNLGDFYRIYSLNCESLSMGGVDHAKQLAWLETDLAEHSAGRHVIAITHKPLFNNICDLHKKTMAYPYRVKPMWRVLEKYGTEFFIAGHAHRLEVWNPKLADGTVSDRGIRQFVIGTGGVFTRGIVGDPHRDCQKVVVAKGIMRFDLHPDRYVWKFTDIAGNVRDSGTQLCQAA